MQVPDIDDAMAQAVDIGENDVSSFIFCFIVFLMLSVLTYLCDRTRKMMQKKQKKMRKCRGTGVS